MGALYNDDPDDDMYGFHPWSKDPVQEEAEYIRKQEEDEE